MGCAGVIPCGLFAYKKKRRTVVYQIKEHDPYIIKGKKGKEYKIPQVIGLNSDDFAILIRLYQTQEPLEKMKICKEFLLHLAPELESEGIGDVEYSKIFEAYENNKTEKQKKKLGES